MRPLYWASMVAAVVLAAAGALAQPSSPWQPARLPAASRRIIHERMQEHGRQMRQLVWDVLLLDFEHAATSAEAIGKGAAPLDRHDEKLEGVGPFLLLQDQLRYRATQLVDAARARDGQAMSTAFSQMSESCVHCHMVYLEPKSRDRVPAPR